MSSTLPKFQIDKRTLLAFDPNSTAEKALMALSRDGGNSFQGMIETAYGWNVRTLAAATDYYTQFVGQDGTSEVIIVTETRGENKMVAFNGKSCKPLKDSIETSHIAFPDPNARAIEQAFSSSRNGHTYYYVLTSLLHGWGSLDRDLRLHWGEKGRFSQPAELAHEHAEDKGSYMVVVDGMTLNINKAQYDRRIRGKDETTNSDASRSYEPSTWEVDGSGDDKSGDLTDLWDKRHALFTHDDGIEEIVRLRRN